MTDQPLAGVRVVALEQAVAAPYCTSRLADAGAEVIKIERPEGDFARGYDRDVHGQSAYFIWLNRGKKSLTLDIKRNEDAALLHAIIAESDVFVQNLAPGAAARAGFDTEELCSRHPRLIGCDISGYGADGPFAALKAYDLLIQCESGLASLTGTPEAPGRVGVSACDIACGMYAHAAILQALVGRTQSGRGARLQVSLFGAMADWLSVPLLQFDYGGRPGRRVGLAHATIAPYGAFEAADGTLVVVAVQNEREWARLAEDILARPDLLHDPRFRDNAARVEHRGVLDDIIGRHFRQHDAASLMTRLAEADIAAGRVNDLAGLSTHPQLKKMLVTTPNGDVALPVPGSGAAAVGPVPTLGAHNEELRRRYGAA